MRCLDDKRLGNQVYNEGMVILRQLLNAPDGYTDPVSGVFKAGWSRHPAVKMWRNHEQALALYLWKGVIELTNRGKYYDDRPWYSELEQHIIEYPVMPPWLGRTDVHSSHRANLLRKDPNWYGRFEWTEAPMEGYVWP